MSDNMARDYAEQLATKIRADVDAGTPYGTGEDGEEYFSGSNVPDANDYLSDVFDIEYRVAGDKSYRSALVMVGCGGPNAYIDTATNDVVVYWGSGPERWGIPASFCDGLDDALSEMWECN